MVLPHQGGFEISGFSPFRDQIAVRQSMVPPASFSFTHRSTLVLKENFSHLKDRKSDADPAGNSLYLTSWPLRSIWVLETELWPSGKAAHPVACATIICITYGNLAPPNFTLKFKFKNFNLYLGEIYCSIDYLFQMHCIRYQHYNNKANICSPSCYATHVLEGVALQMR